MMLALDIDGTLLRADGASPAVQRAVANAIEAGINVVIATGRGLAATRPVLQELRVQAGFSVTSNGSQTSHWSEITAGTFGFERLHEIFFHPEVTARAIIEALPNVLIGADDGDEGMRVSELFPQGELLNRQRQQPLAALLNTPTTRMIARAPWMERDEFEALLNSLLLTDVEYAVGWTSWADFTPAGCTKATALEVLAADLGVAEHGTVAIGDGTNDISMLKWAAHGVAMGGASQVVVEAAEATTGPVDFDGAAAVIDAILERY